MTARTLAGRALVAARGRVSLPRRRRAAVRLERVARWLDPTRPYVTTENGPGLTIHNHGLPLARITASDVSQGRPKPPGPAGQAVTIHSTAARSGDPILRGLGWDADALREAVRRREERERQARA